MIRLNNMWNYLGLVDRFLRTLLLQLRVLFNFTFPSGRALIFFHVQWGTFCTSFFSSGKEQKRQLPPVPSCAPLPIKFRQGARGGAGETLSVFMFACISDIQWQKSKLKWSEIPKPMIVVSLRVPEPPGWRYSERSGAPKAHAIVRGF